MKGKAIDAFACIWAFFLLAVITICIGETRTQLFIKHPADFNLYLVQMDSPLYSSIHCTAMCYDMGNCDAATVNDGQCRRGWMDSGPIVPGSLLYTRAYSVFVVEGSEGKYTLDINQASVVCQQLGTTMASVDDLRAARAQGFGPCECGWLTDGYCGIVLQQPNYDCFVEYSTDVLNCYQTTCDVYCKSIIL